MEVRELQRVAIDRWISVARLPLDAAVRLLPGDPGPRSTARLAIDGTEATLRRAVGSLLNDDAMCADAERRRVAVQERRRAIELRDAADDKRRVADDRLSEELQRVAELREQTAREAEAKIQKTEADRERRKARVREAAAAKEHAAEVARSAQLDELRGGRAARTAADDRRERRRTGSRGRRTRGGAGGGTSPRRGFPSQGGAQERVLTFGQRQIGTKRVPITVCSASRPSTSSRSTPGRRVGPVLEPDARAARPHEIDPPGRLALDDTLQHVPPKNATASASTGVRSTTRRSRAGGPGGRRGIGPPARMHVGTVRRDVVEHLGAPVGMAVRLGELHDGAVRLASA